MAKFLVLKRTPVQMKMEGNILSDGELVEFVMIPDTGISQVQVYFVPNDKTDLDILGVATAHHENELGAKNIVFSGPQSPLNGIQSNPEPIVDVSYTANGTGAISIVDSGATPTVEAASPLI
jgi:hypothetical protein